MLHLNWNRLSPDPRFSRDSESPFDEILANEKAALRDQFLAELSVRLDRVLEDRFAGLARQLEDRLARETEDAAAEARHAALRRLSEDLNQALRRLRLVRTPEEVTRWLVEASAPYCPRVAVFGLNGPFVEGLAIRGVESEASLALFDALDFPLEEAPALAAAARDGETVAALAARSEVSSPIVDVFHHHPDEKVHLFPLVVRGETGAIFYAAPGAGAVDAAPLELLAQMASTAAETLVHPAEAPAKAAPELIQIEGVALPAPRGGVFPEWSALSREEQQLHLNARRFARVHVAEMRLYRPDAVESGRARWRLYSALKPDIDAAREEFRQKFMLATPTMVDYLHLELVRTLAHDNPVLLGRDYPGALA